MSCDPNVIQLYPFFKGEKGDPGDGLSIMFNSVDDFRRYTGDQPVAVLVNPYGTGTFKNIGASSILTDDGVVYVKDAKNRYWQRTGSGFLDVRLWGVVLEDPAVSADNGLALQRAAAARVPLWFPAGRIYYNRTIDWTAQSKGIMTIADAGSVLIYQGTEEAILLKGNSHDIKLGEVAAPGAKYVVRYSDLEYSKIHIMGCGMSTIAAIFHDPSIQTITCGNNRWTFEHIEAGGMPYGIKLDSHATNKMEGDVWDVKVIMSAGLSSIRVGTPGNNTIRWNEFNVAPDAQGITPTLIEVNNDSNFFNVRTWQGLVGENHVKFGLGTGSNYLISQTGVQGALNVQDLGRNAWQVVGVAGQTVMGGQVNLGLPSGNGYSKLAVADSQVSGTNVVELHNLSAANVLTKYAGIKYRGRDTIGTGKDVAIIRSNPIDADWIASSISFHTRQGDQIVLAAEFSNGTGIFQNGLAILNPYTPANSNVAGTRGQINWDANFIYVCTTPNKWKRAALVDF